jgi:hypothetical protein
VVLAADPPAGLGEHPVVWRLAEASGLEMGSCETRVMVTGNRSETQATLITRPATVVRDGNAAGEARGIAKFSKLPLQRTVTTPLHMRCHGSRNNKGR